MQNEQFLIERQKGIGGSDVAAIMGLSPWKTPLDIYLEKKTPLSLEDSLDQEIDKPQLARGRRCEKYILEEYSDRTGCILAPGSLVIHPDFPILRGNIDAFVEGNEGIVIEAKSVGGSPASWDNEIPIYYKTQVAFYAMITNCERVDVAVLFDRWQYTCFSYYRDEEFEEKILKSCIKFWLDYICYNIPPAPSNLKDIQSLYPKSEYKGCDVTPKIQWDLKALSSIQKEIKMLSESADLYKLSIMEYVKDADTLLDGENVLATWKTQNRSILDTDRLKKEHPKLIDKYKKDQTTRVFRLKGDK